MEYIEEIILWVGTALATLSGSCIGLGTLFKWIKGIINGSVDKLSVSREGYDKMAKHLEKTADKIDSASEEMVLVANKLETFANSLDYIKGLCSHNDENYAKIIQAISILATSDKYLVANGKAREITDLLGTTPQEIRAGEVRENA